MILENSGPLQQQNNFFTDLHSVQRPPSNVDSQDDPFNKYELTILYRHFKYKDPENGLKCLIYLERIKQGLRPLLANLVSPELVENVVDLCLWQALKDFKSSSRAPKGILKKLPQNNWLQIKDDLEYVTDNIPADFFNPVGFDSSSSIDIKSKMADLIFHIPMTERDPEIDEEINDIRLIAPPSGDTYNVYQRYQLYKGKMAEFPYDEFREIITNGLNSSKTNEELINDYLDLFGCEVFEFINEIIENRGKKFEWSSEEKAPAQTSQQQLKVFNMNSRGSSRTPAPTVASQITVQTEEEMMYAKALRKMEKKQMKLGQDLELTNELEEDLSYLKQQPIFKRGLPQGEIEDLPHVHDQLRNVSVTAKFNGVTFKQPENTVKNETSTHVEFTIPGSGTEKHLQIPLINISELDQIGRLVFKDIKQLNRIQSEVFPTAYYTNENMLICAPTGAGKTNIALLTIVHQIKQHMEGNFIRKDDFKVVYVCPMKALATEMVANFSKKLGPVGIVVREVTGDMQLTKKEIAETQILVTTPEKWDVISRKGSVDTEVTSLLKLLILDEVHLLNTDRGPVIEALVARTLRQVLSSQSIIRLVALSATLPGYLDVANFLKVNPRTGLYFFDNRFRSVPLTMTFIGVKKHTDNEMMDTLCFNKIVPIVKDGQQAMVFVTSRNLTSVTANNLLNHTRNNGLSEIFIPPKKKLVGKRNFKSGDLEELVQNGFGIHHAGMCRHDRLEVEALFRQGTLKVIVCTTTLAWGVNLPAHAVIIRGTTRYDAQKSSFVDMDMLDVMQIFGRAGRPQYDTSGHGMIMTSMANVTKYMSLLTAQVPIESQFLNFLPDNLNAEIVLGTVSNLKEAMEWLTNSFLYCRIKKNPLIYGLTFTDIWDTDKLYQYLERRLFEAAQILENAQMIRFDQTLGELRPTNYGRISSFYYIAYETMKYFHDNFKRTMMEADILLLISNASEFKHIQVRNDELDELDRLHHDYSEFDFNLDTSSVVYKVLTLIQANISRARIRVTSLISDCEFIMQSVQRLARALLEVAVDKNYALQVNRCLLVAQTIEQQTWPESQPLKQFKDLEVKSGKSLDLLRNVSMDQLQEMSERDLCDLLHNRSLGTRIYHYVKAFPTVDLDVTVKPITDGVIRIQLIVNPKYLWDNGIHGNVQHYYAWVEDPSHDNIYHFESFVITKKLVMAKEPVELVFTVPLSKPLPPEYYVTIANSKYMHASRSYPIDLEKLNLLPSQTIQTKFLNVRPLPKTALHNPEFEKLYSFTHFNAVQSQVFHCCYNTTNNVLLGAPTGSGKTIVSEICILRQFTENPELKVVYIAPMKALVRERVQDWTPKFQKLNKKVIEVTGDITPKSNLISTSDIIITTPEKWDGMSRNWLQKDFVKQVGLVIIDEIHLLAEERGPVLEVIVSRTNYINNTRKTKVRLVGLSTAMANAGDLANWLDVDRVGLYNFSSSVRPVPLEIHLKGFSAKNYCPRMATMNRPAYQAICQYAPDSPTLIFVSSRKQTRITSYDLIKSLLSDTNPKQWLRCPQSEIEELRHTVVDSDLAYLILFGIGIHHAGLQDGDRKIVEHLFVTQKIQVLVATATLAWGVNFPAHLVIIKGTEYYDGATKRYLDMPVTDVLQMMGRAGRPQFDTSGVACVFVQENKKNFYRKFLFEPFPVESSLLDVLPEHVNAEIANGTITCRTQLLDFICSTFFFRRLLVNPTYYKMEDSQDPNLYLNELAESVAGRLQELEVVTVNSEEVGDFYESTYLGYLAAQYYISCKSVKFLNDHLTPDCSLDDLVLLMCQVEEYALFPVRHNEDNINKHLVSELGIKTRFPFDSPHLKVMLLVKCYLSDKKLPNQEYVVDLKSVFDQIIRIMQAMISLLARKSWLDCTKKLIRLCQMLIQGYQLDLEQIPLLTRDTCRNLFKLLEQRHMLPPDCKKLNLATLNLLFKTNHSKFVEVLNSLFDDVRLKELTKVFNWLPMLFVSYKIKNLSSSTEDVSYEIDLNDKTIKLDAQSNNKLLVEFRIKREGSNNQIVYSKKFSKQKEESWFFILARDDDLINLQRFTVRKWKNLEVSLETPQERGVYYYYGYFMSDSYLGLDQKLVFKVTVLG